MGLIQLGLSRWITMTISAQREETGVTCNDDYKGARPAISIHTSGLQGKEN